MAAALAAKRVQSREVILEAATRLIAERGFNAVTVQDVLEAARVTKGKFFHYFTSKDELFSELLRFALEERGVLNFDEIVSKCKSVRPINRLLYLLDHLIEWHTKGLPEGMRLCLLATFFFSPDSPELRRVNRILSANTKTFERLIKSCQKTGELPAELDQTVLALLFPSAAVGANVIGFLCGEKKLTSKSLIELRKIIVCLNRACCKTVSKREGR